MKNIKKFEDYKINESKDKKEITIKDLEDAFDAGVDSRNGLEGVPYHSKSYKEGLEEDKKEFIKKYK